MKQLIYLIFVSAFLGSLGRIIGDGEGLTVTVFQLLMVLAFSVWTLKIFRNGDFEVELTGLEILIILFLAIICFSLIISSNQLTGFINLIRFVILILMILMIVNVFQKMEDVRMAIILISIIGVGLGGFSAINYLLNPEISAFNYLMQGATSIGRSSIGDDDPNYFAAMLFLSATTLGTIVHSKLSSNIRLVSLIGFLIVLSGIISTFSRSAWLALFIALVLIVVLTKNYRFILAAVLILPIVLLFISPDLTVLLDTITERVLSIFEAGEDKSSSMRLVLGFAALEMFVESNGLGVGFGAFPEVFDRINNTYGMYAVNQPHNITYQILAELGIIGFVIFALILLKLLFIAYGNVKITRNLGEWHKIISIALLSAFIGYLVFHQFIPRFLTNSTLMITIGLILTHHKILEQYSKNPKDGEKVRAS